MKKGTLLILVFSAMVTGAARGADAEKWSAPDPKLRNIFMLARTELEWPGLDIKTAAKNLGTADKACAFVRDEVMYVSYRGNFSDGDCTLRTRTANSIDKAVLLGLLLKEMKQPVRLVKSTWPAGAEPFRAKPKPKAFPSLKFLQQFAAPHAKDFAGDQKKVIAGYRERTRKKFTESKDETDRALQTVQTVLAAKGILKQLKSGKPTDPATEDEWVWVQLMHKDGKWRDLDPVFPDLPRPKEFNVLGELRPVKVALRLESVADNGQATELIDWQGAAAHLLGNDVTIGFLPAGKGTRSLGEIKDISKVALWMPTMKFGPNRKSGRIFSVGKDASPAPKKKGGGGLFGGGGFGFFQPLPKQPPKPKKAAYLRLSITTSDTTSSKPWERTVTRVIQDLTGSFTAHELVSNHRIGYCLSAVPPRVVQARMIDELVDLYRYRQAAAKVKVTDSPGLHRGIPVRTARTVNALIGALSTRAREGMAVSWNGPMLFLESMRLKKKGDQIHTAAVLDVLNLPFKPGKGSTPSDRLGWGLAICSAEGLLLDSPSVNAGMIAEADKLKIFTIMKRSLPPDLVDQVLAAKGLVVASSATPKYAWAIRPDGELYGVIRAGGTTAKGARNSWRNPGAERARDAADAFGSFASGAASAMGAPFGMLITPLVWYFKELADAYLIAANKLEAIAKTIESGDDSHLNDPGTDDYFNNLGNRLLSTLAAGGLRGYAESVVGAAVGPYVPGGAAGDFATGAGLSYVPFPTDVTPEMVEGAMRYMASRGSR